MTWDQWLGGLASLVVVLSGVGALLLRSIRNYTTVLVNELVKTYLSELKPNHGSSLRDAINAIQDDMVDIKVNVAVLEGKFDQHIAETNK